MLDQWQEILTIMWRNPLRVILTSFSIAWGIFMLVILMGAVKALQNGTNADFAGDASNSLWISTGKTNLAYKGFKPGREIIMDNDDLGMLTSGVTNVESGSARNNYWYISPTITYGKRSTSFEILGVTPGYRFLESLTITSGRFINEVDMQQKRKVAALGKLAYEQLFEPGEEAVGEYINVNGVMYKVIGVFTDPGGQRDMSRMYVPITTSQALYDKPNQTDNIILLIPDGDVAGSKLKATEAKKLLKEKHTIHPDDKRAIYISNNVEQVAQIQMIFTALNLVMWVVGIMTILIGVVGIGNIMLITVKERTREIGIRKALGATPFSIIMMILQEALLMTVSAGYLGLVAGIGLIQLIASIMSDAGVDQHGRTNSYLGRPEVDVNVAIVATLILVFAGVIAGLIPAVRAARVNPITAIRDI